MPTCPSRWGTNTTCIHCFNVVWWMVRWRFAIIRWRRRVWKALKGEKSNFTICQITNFFNKSCPVWLFSIKLTCKRQRIKRKPEISITTGKNYMDQPNRNKIKNCLSLVTFFCIIVKMFTQSMTNETYSQVLKMRPHPLINF